MRIAPPVEDPPWLEARVLCEQGWGSEKKEARVPLAGRKNEGLIRQDKEHRKAHVLRDAKYGMAEGG